MGCLFTDVRAAAEPVASEPVPTWLRDLLINIAGRTAVEVDPMTPEQAGRVMEAFWSQPRDCPDLRRVRRRSTDQ